MKNQLKELLILHFLNDGVRTTLIVLLPLIAVDLSLSLTEVGFLGSSQALLGAFLALPTGFIVGKFGGYKVITALLLIYSLGIFCAAFAMNAPVLLFTYLIAAFGFGMFHPAGFALTAKFSDGDNVGRNMGNFTSIGEIGRVALPPIALFMAALVGWRIVIGVIGAIGVLLFVLALFHKPQKDMYTLGAKNADSESHKDFLKHTFSLFKNKAAGYVTSAAIIDSIASSPIYVFLPFLVLAKGISPIQLSIVMGGFFIGSLAGKYVLGRISDKYGQRKVFIFSEIFMSLSLICVTLTNMYLLIIFFSALLGVFTKGTSPIVQSMFSHLANKEHYHKVFAVSELVITIASVISITMLGAIADQRGMIAIFYVCASLAIIAAVPIVILSKVTTKT